MKAAWYSGIKQLKVQDMPDPKAGPGEIIVKTKYCGICGTDVHTYHYESLYEPNQVLGHETVGTVAEVGEGVKDWKVGDRVARTVGRDGFAEYIKAKPQELVRIPDSVSFEEAVFWDPVCVALHGIRLSQFRLGDNVLVTGAGAIGCAAVQLLTMHGANNITILELIDKKRELAFKFGATNGFNPQAEGAELTKKVMALYGGNGVDVAYEVAGTPSALQACINTVKRNGQVVIIGVTSRETPIQASYLVRRQMDIKASFIFNDDDIRICFDFMAKHLINTKDMISDIIGLDDIVSGLERLVKPEEALIKVIVAPNG